MVFFFQKNKKMLVDEASHPFQFGTAEKKLLIVFCYYVVLAAVALTGFTLSTRNNSQFIMDIQKYFLCEQSGCNSNRPCRINYNRYSYPSMTLLGYVLLGLFPVVNLIYAINLTELKEIVQKLRFKEHQKKKAYSKSNTPSTGSTVAMTSTLN